MLSLFDTQSFADAEDECLPQAAPGRQRVLHVFARLQRGGAELRTLEALQALGERVPAETHILVHSGEQGELDDDFRRAGAVLHHERLTAANFAIRFVRLLRRERIDAVHSHVQYLSGWFLMLAWMAGVKRRISHLWITSNPPTLSPFRALHRRVGRLLLGCFATRILAVGRDTMANAFSAEWESDTRCRVIYGGIPAAPPTPAQLDRTRREVRAELGAAENDTVVCHVGRFDEAKNHRRVVEIFAAMPRGARLLLVGGGNAAIEQRVRQQVARLGLGEFVTFAGTRRDVVRLLTASDVFLFPSRREGLPGVVLEALSVGTLCVASAIAGTREIARFSSGLDLIDLAEPNETWASRVEAAARNRSVIGRVERIRDLLIACD
jgi:glycosyltransferase involved in cell wall biosynthesis